VVGGIITFIARKFGVGEASEVNIIEENIYLNLIHSPLCSLLNLMVIPTISNFSGKSIMLIFFYYST